MNTFGRVILIIGMLLCVRSTFAQPIAVAIVPAAQNVPVGTAVEIALVISGLGDFVPPSLGTFDLDVTFDPSILVFRSAVFGDQLGLGSVTEVQPGVMNVNLFELSLEDPADLDARQPGSFTLVTLAFETLIPGTSPLAVLINALGDANGDPLEAEAGSGTLTVVVPPVLQCSAGDVGCLIRAITLANAADDATTILLAAGTYDLTEVNNNTDGANGLPSITSNITITGAGVVDCAGGDPDCTTIARAITASDAFRIIHVAETGGVLTLNGVIIHGGNASDLGGGGIFNAGTLTVTNSTIGGNTDESGAGGGGIFNTKTGILTVTNSTIGAVEGAFLGGNSTADNGGGIFNTGTLTVTASAIVGNAAGEDGGGIFNAGTLTVTNSTIYGNTGEEGGGIINGDGTATLISSTISNNLSDGLGGGGILNGSGTLTVTHSILAGNFLQDQEFEPFPPIQHNDCEGEITSQGHNLVGKDTGCPSNGPGDLTVASDAVFTTVLETALSNHGGPTPTQALLPVPFNPAINAGASVCTDASGTPLRQDQRGEPRPRGRACDIGAFEVTNPPPPVRCRGLRATIVGTPGDDVLIGTVGADVIHGLGGDDVIDGLDGDDTICGGDGDDILFGGDGRDRLFGDAGSDALDGGDGQDVCRDGAGRDSVVNCEPVASVAHVP